MFTMKEACEQTHLPYETLKFYCNQGLVPNVKRDKNNRRIFNDRDIAWINSLNCLKNCGMSIAEMKEYIELCLIGESTIPERKVILDIKRKSLVEQLKIEQNRCAMTCQGCDAIFSTFSQKGSDRIVPR